MRVAARSRDTTCPCGFARRHRGTNSRVRRREMELSPMGLESMCSRVDIAVLHLDHNQPYGLMSTKRLNGYNGIRRSSHGPDGPYNEEFGPRVRSGIRRHQEVDAGPVTRRRTDRDRTRTALRDESE